MVEERLLAHAAHHPQVLLELAAAIVELLVHQVHDIHAVVWQQPGWLSMIVV